MSNIITEVIENGTTHPVVADYHFPAKGSAPVPVIVILHGLKGFKDWGQFPLIAQHLSRSGFGVVRVNFSMNGTSPEHPAEFVDLEAYGYNTYAHELADVKQVLENIWWKSGDLSLDPERIGILGHSRGGGIALLSTVDEPRIKAVATWASVCEFESRMNPPDLEEWKKNGVHFQFNSRTQQNMPVYLDIRNDFLANAERYNIRNAVEKLSIPQLIVHGKKDETVSFKEAEHLHSWNLFSKLVLIEDANHTFGGRHPWNVPTLPKETVEALQETINFFRENL
ncbi:MAG TPA: alpha/beta fold hydrolase [Bacteroidia bacterium]|nr:alpha/beta fold hydrolase [Bacteroidia bacterium]